MNYVPQGDRVVDFPFESLLGHTFDDFNTKTFHLYRSTEERWTMQLQYQTDAMLVNHLLRAATQKPFDPSTARLAHGLLVSSIANHPTQLAIGLQLSVSDSNKCYNSKIYLYIYIFTATQSTRTIKDIVIEMIVSSKRFHPRRIRVLPGRLLVFK
jgi:hypothetical protein